MAKASVIIPTYNRSNIVTRAIHSVLSQTLKDLEVIVVDDGSTDDTRQVLEAIDDSRVNYFYKHNSGPAGARNMGIDHAHGDYIAFLDSDDYWPNNYLEVMIEKLERFPEYGAVYSPITMVFQDGNQIQSYTCPKAKEGWITADIFIKGFIWTSAAVFRSESWKNFSFDEKLGLSSEDSDAFLRISTKIQFCFTADVESYHNESQDSLSTVQGINPNRLLSLERFYFKLAGNRFIPKKLAFKKLSKSSHRLAKYYYKERMKRASMYYYKKALYYRPFNLKLYMGILKCFWVKNSQHADKHWKSPDLPSTIQTSRIFVT
jgi:glycosyltransferase involved in cell wall biosynthesis